MRTWFTQDKIRAVDAKFEAQKIAFAPYVFQAAVCLRDFGILRALFEAGDTGLSEAELVKKSGLSEYGLRVLVEMGLSSDILKIRDPEGEWRFLLGKIGFFLLEDPMTTANMDFLQDVCYEGAFRLKDSLEQGAPAGLKVFGDWKTIYEGLSRLPAPVQKSWFAFDHHYSDGAFQDALKVVFKTPKKHLMDIGGNTAKWAMKCYAHDPQVRVTIIDLPGQAAMARENIRRLGADDRISIFEANMLEAASQLPGGADAVWMSQFLDCFSLAEVTSILRKVSQAVDAECDVFVMEPLWDKQTYPAAVFSLHATSLYFTNMANGNSKMYAEAELVAAVAAAGFRLEEAVHDLGPIDYSILRFRKNA